MADRFYKVGQRAIKDDRDEELAYVNFMKYFHIITHIQKTDEYKKDKKFVGILMNKYKCEQVLDDLERLTSKLKTRYYQKWEEHDLKRYFYEILS